MCMRVCVTQVSQEALLVPLRFRFLFLLYFVSRYEHFQHKLHTKQYAESLKEEAAPSFSKSSITHRKQCYDLGDRIFIFAGHVFKEE